MSSWCWSCVIDVCDCVVVDDIGVCGVGFVLGVCVVVGAVLSDVGVDVGLCGVSVDSGVAVIVVIMVVIVVVLFMLLLVLVVL